MRLLAFLALVLALSLPALAQQPGSPQPSDTAIVGTVMGPGGPEAGVWVIAETIGLPTKFAKIVVTDDRGRYVIPDLPKVSYTVWVRGYGLVDSPKVHTLPGKVIDLKALPAPSAAVAAEYYPAIYWYAMLGIPERGAFPLGPSPRQEHWLDVIKTDGCYTCHQLGNKATRTLPKNLGQHASSAAAWERRIQSGQAATQMVANIGRVDTARALKLFGDWTDRIAAGELPFAKPPRPQGVERNVVLSLWDWAGPKDYLHDEISTDRRKPTVNPRGPLYGATEESTERLPVLDPVRSTRRQIVMPVREVRTPSARELPVLAPSPYWGEEQIWDARTSVHNPMLDEQARVWFTARIRPPISNPAFCRAGSEHPSAKLFPLNSSNRQLAMFDPRTNQFALIDTCFPTHHLQFGYDADNTLWTSAGGPGSGVVGWFNRRIYDETGDEAKAQGWTALILDTNGNGKRDDYVEPGQPLDPTKDTRVAAAFYGVSPNPADGSVWGSSLGFPGAIVRLAPGAHPPQTALAEIYEPPLDGDKAPIHGYSPRGMDITSTGVVWASLASGHFGSFDRRKCEGPLNGPKATGKHCPEGWTLYPFPGPNFKTVSGPGSAEASYYAWVDQHDTFGLGKDVPIATGNANDALLALVDGKWVVLRVPYPMGFYAKGLDGRIDDPTGGWKGRGLWSTYSTRAPFHVEGGKGTTSKVVHFQLRPDPLAR